ncbi:uncharacterized protein LOC126571406 [Anopheles aquasalis]|uniref:uncharacterized protein LOC126571406 n=1 Tax=Anopheles aquasalis TaxID=42839 RepID=UPI00215B2D34|nr:uncharacterized protein LOC126571406 [Anopheles aquasalis]
MEARNKRISRIPPPQVPAFRQSTVKSSASVILSSKPPIKSRKSTSIPSTSLATRTRPLTVAANTVSQTKLMINRTDQAKTNGRVKFVDKHNIPLTPSKSTSSAKDTKVHTTGTIPKYLLKQKQWSMTKDPNAVLQGVPPVQEKSAPPPDASQPSPVIDDAQLDAQYFKQYSKKLEKRVAELLDELGAREERIAILQKKLRTAMDLMQQQQQAVRRTA